MADCVRRLIGLRSPPDWIAFAVRLDCVRRLIGLRPLHDDTTCTFRLQDIGMPSP